MSVPFGWRCRHLHRGSRAPTRRRERSEEVGGRQTASARRSYRSPQRQNADDEKPDWTIGFSDRQTEADARTRTGDPFITSEVLYQLSYVGGASQSSPRPRR